MRNVHLIFMVFSIMFYGKVIYAQQELFSDKEESVSFDVKKMTAEADSFVCSLPVDRQHYQSLAIKDAMHGDFTALMHVRTSRSLEKSLPEGVTAKYVNEKMRLYYPVDLTEDERLPCLIYLHGGCWAFGSINSCARYCYELCRQYRLIVLAIDYALAPSFPYPFALNDIMQCADFIFNHAFNYRVDPHRISIGGDSAGGNLAIVAAIQRQQQGKQKFSSLVLFYPVVKLWDDESESRKLYGKNAGLDAELMDVSNLAYVGNQDSHKPEISPIMFSDEVLKELPKTLCVAADRDILKDQGIEFVNRLMGLGVDIKYYLLPGTYHLFITVDGQEEAFSQSVRLSGEFLK